MASRPKVEGPAAARRARIPKSKSETPQVALDRVIADERQGHERCEHARGWMSFPDYSRVHLPCRVRRVKRGTESFGIGEQPTVTQFTGTLIKRAKGKGGSRYAVVVWDDWTGNGWSEARRTGKVIAPNWDLMKEPKREEEG